MKKFLIMSLIQVLFTGLFLQAQKFQVKSGSFDFLKGQKTLLAQYDYSNMAVGKFDKEADYIDSKVNEGNKAEAGKGDKWKSEWFDKRSNAYEPAFEELFNKYMEKEGLTCSKTSKDATYSMNIHTIFTDVGYFIGVSSRPSYISAEITFTKIASGEKMAVILVEKCPGIGGLKEAYAKLGKSLSGFLLKKM